jgi:hypothetical protein
LQVPLVWSQTSPGWQGEHVCRSPHPRSTGEQPWTSPASSASAHVLGVQQPPSESHTSPLPHVPQLTGPPQPLLSVPHVAPLQLGGVHGVQTPPTHLLLPLQVAGHATARLPHAFCTLPQRTPASVSHSGGVVLHTPPRHCCPLGQPHCFVWPQPSVIVPQRFVCPLVHESGAHRPASEGIDGTHWLLTQLCPVWQPPQLIGTPHESVPMTPHCPAQDLGWQLVDPLLPTQTCPLRHACPHAYVLPVQRSV